MKRKQQSSRIKVKAVHGFLNNQKKIDLTFNLSASAKLFFYKDIGEGAQFPYLLVSLQTHG